MFIGIPKHWRLSIVQVQNVYWLIEFSLSTQGERETQLLLCWPFHLTQQTRGASHRPQLDSSRPASNLNWPRPASDLNKLRFFQNHQESQPIASGHDVICTPVSISIWVFIITSVIVTSSAHEREHLRSICVPARSLSRIVLSLTKPNDKIQPTKNDNIKKNHSAII